MPFEFPWKIEAPPGNERWQILVISLIGFVLLVWVFRKLVIPMLAEPLTDRQKAIAGEAQQVEQTYRETAQMKSDYEGRLQGIQQETEQRLQEAVREAEGLREHILAEAHEQAGAVVRRAEAEVDRSRAKAMVSVRAQFVNDVIQAAEYAASRSLEAPQQEQLVSRFVDQVGARA